MDTPTLSEVMDILYTSSSIQGWGIVSRSTKELYIKEAVASVAWRTAWDDTYDALVKYIEDRITTQTHRQIANGC